MNGTPVPRETFSRMAPPGFTQHLAYWLLNRPHGTGGPQLPPAPACPSSIEPMGDQSQRQFLPTPDVDNEEQHRGARRASGRQLSEDAPILGAQPPSVKSTSARRQAVKGLGRSVGRMESPKPGEYPGLGEEGEPVGDAPVLDDPAFDDACLVEHHDVDWST